MSGEVLGDIFLGNIKKWNDSAIADMNKTLKLPDKEIIIHRESPPGLKTIIGDYISKTHPKWADLKKDGDISGPWPASAIMVKTPPDNIAMLKKTLFSIGYGPIQMVFKEKLSYVKLKGTSKN